MFFDLSWIASAADLPYISVSHLHEGAGKLRKTSCCFLLLTTVTDHYRRQCHVTDGTVRFFMNFQMTAPLQVAKENSELYNRHCRSKKRYMDKWLNGTEVARAEKIYMKKKKSFFSHFYCFTFISFNLSNIIPVELVIRS